MINIIEQLVYRLFIVPPLAASLNEKVPKRPKKKSGKEPDYIELKLSGSSQDLKKLFEELKGRTITLNKENIVIESKKHYVAFKTSKNFMCVEIFPKNNNIKLYLSLNVEAVTLDSSFMRDVRKIGHFGTGNLELTINNNTDFDKIMPFIKEAYELS